MIPKTTDATPDHALQDLGLLDFLSLDDDREVETTRSITPRIARADLKRQAITMMKREHLRDVLKAKPAPGTAYHLISNGKYDFWTWIPVLIEMMGHADAFYGSTWTLNRQACTELLDLFDQAKIRKISMLTGLYFKRRETAVYAKLMTGLTDRRQRYICLENHAKVTLLANHQTGDYLTVEGSANYTANPRIEQYVICNDRTIYDFHRAWMEEVLTA